MSTLAFPPIAAGIHSLYSSEETNIHNHLDEISNGSAVPWYAAVKVLLLLSMVLAVPNKGSSS